MSLTKRSKYFDRIINEPGDMSPLEHLLAEADYHREELEGRILNPKNIVNRKKSK